MPARRYAPKDAERLIDMGLCPWCGHIRTLLRLRAYLGLAKGADLEAAVAAVAAEIRIRAAELPPTAPTGQLALFGAIPLGVNSGH